MVKQRNKSDCVIASVAQLTGESYAAVKRKFGKIERGGIELHEIDWLLNEYGRWRMITPRKNYTLRQWADKHDRSLIVAGSSLFAIGHAYAAVDGTIFNPASHVTDENYLVSFAWIVRQPLPTSPL